MGDPPAPLRVVRAVAPIRICDIGGWTDTWFARHGKVFNIGVSPDVEVEINLYEAGAVRDRVVLEAESYGDRYGFELGSPPGRHPLLEAAVEELGLPDGTSAEISIASAVPPGCSTGTSAAVMVALVGGLDALTPGRMSRHEIASTAHGIELGLGLESGVQDQLCAAYGGVNFIEIQAYPESTVSQLPMTEATWQQLEQRLLLVFLGRAHVSSEVHEKVIALFEREGEQSSVLDELRGAAEDAREAVRRSDLEALGQAMRRNTDAQRRLHPDLVCHEAQSVIDVAMAGQASGWKVNGAGGEGGSVTLLCAPGPRAKEELVQGVQRVCPSAQVIPIAISRHGLRLWSA
ncbi:MAG TPA: hypothetical protein VK283_14260 [Acidimicrobiales bacterium]|nr:hypothetical protein [Acidimicrobiales bacterium]